MLPFVVRIDMVADIEPAVRREVAVNSLAARRALLPKKGNLRTRKALMRGRAVDGPIQAAACSASLHRGGNTVFHRTLADSVEAVFILVAFRRFAQFLHNQREKTTDSCNEKACGYDHD
jgi:hypothetical protein